MKPPDTIANAGGWSAAVRAAWDALESPHREPYTITSATHWTPRPWRNEYDRGSREEGFTYVISPGRQVWTVTIGTADLIECEPDEYGLAYLVAGRKLPVGTRAQPSIYRREPRCGADVEMGQSSGAEEMGRA